MCKWDTCLSEELTASLEDYLETIYLIISEKEAVRPKDIAKRLDVSNASVTGALKTLADKNLALEINTAGLRREIGQTSPTLEYVKLFRELGGELLTFGSDAHRAQDLGAGLDVAIDMAKEAGFSHFAFYKKREPRMLRLM